MVVLGIAEVTVVCNNNYYSKWDDNCIICAPNMAFPLLENTVEATPLQCRQMCMPMHGV